MVVGAVLAFFYNPDHTPPPKEPVIRPAKTAVVEAAGKLAERSFTGAVQAGDQVDLSFRIAGPLTELPVKAGDQVSKGDLLAQIDPRDFRTTLQEIQSNLKTARAELTKMKAGARAEDLSILKNQVQEAKLALENAEVEEARWRKLFEQGVESKSRYDKRRLALDVAKEKYAAAQSELERGQTGARQEDLDAQAARISALEEQERAASDKLNDTSLKAPFSGRIAKRYVENFQDVRARQPIVSLQNIGSIKVVADVPESVMVLLRREFIEKMSVTFDVPDSPEFDVELTEVDVQADPRSQTYAVSVSLPAPEQYSILPGMSASLRLYLNDRFEAQGGVPVPSDAILADPAGASFVWTVKEPAMTVHRVPVTMGAASGDNVMVTSGLKGGERVVTAGVHFLEEGQQIRLLQTKP